MIKILTGNFQIVHPTSPVRDDFIGTSQPTVFPAGIGQLERSVFFTVRNDALAEPDETFSIVLKVTNGDGMVGNPNTGTVTIAASDDAFGVFSIEEVLVFVYLPDTHTYSFIYLHPDSPVRFVNG